MSLTWIVGIATLSLSGKPAQETLQFEKTFGAQKVTLSVPNASSALASFPSVASGKFRFAALPDGRLSQPFMADGGPKDWIAADEAAKSAPVSRVKVFVLTQVDALEVSPSDSATPNLARPIRGRMERADIEAFYQEMVAFTMMAQASTGGTVRVEPDIQMDTGTYYAESPEVFPGDELLQFVGPRVNGAPFESDDKTFRGPYDLVVVVHAGLSDTDSSFSHWGTPVASVSYTRNRLLGGEFGFAKQLTCVYANALGHTARTRGFMDANQAGFGLNPKPVSYFWEANGAVASDFARSSGEGYIRHAVPEPKFANIERVSGVAWSAVRDDPLSKLRFYSGQEIRDVLGVSESGYDEVQQLGTGLSHGYFYVGDAKNKNPRPFKLDGSVDLANENVGVHRNGSTTYLWVASRAADAVFSNWKQPQAPTILGLGLMADRPFVLAKVEGAFSAATEADLVGLTPSESPKTSATLDIAQAGRSWGTASREFANDPIAGPAATLKVVFPLYLGGMEILAPRDSGPEFGPNKGVRLRVKANDTGEWQLRLHVEGGTTPTLKGVFKIAEAEVGQWVQVDVKLPNPGGQATIQEAWIEVPSASTSYSPLVIRRGEIAVASFEIVTLDNAAPWSPSPVTPTLESKDPVQRALVAANAPPENVEAIAAMLNDTHDLVRLNACRFFTKVKLPAAEPILTDLTRWMDSRVSEAACNALMAQGTQSGIASVKTTLEIGPSDDNRLFAAISLAPLKDTFIMSNYAALFGSRRWQVRQAAANAIGQMNDRNASMLLMVFFQEVDPLVRMTVTQVADIKQDNVLRQILYSSVNDTSESVRAASYVRLSESEAAQYQNEGLKGVRDESWIVRATVLEAWGPLKNEKFRGVMRQGVVDEVPQVRAAALRGFALLPGEVKLEEIQPALADRHPEVVKAMEELKKAKSIG